jgi:hypothetical protein
MPPFILHGREIADCGVSAVWVKPTLDYSELTDAGGLACERLFDKWADPSWSATDRERVETACKQLFDLGEFTYGTPRLLTGWMEDLARHLLAPHTEALEYLAGKAAAEQRVPDVTRTLFTMFPHYKSYQPLFEGDWRQGWLGVLGDYEEVHEAQVERWEAMRRRLVRRFGP